MSINSMKSESNSHNPDEDEALEKLLAEIKPCSFRGGKASIIKTNHYRVQCSCL